MTTKRLSIDLTKNEYEELLAKLANELEDYNEEASCGLKNSFIKIAKAELFNDIYETTLVKKYKNKLL